MNTPVGRLGRKEKGDVMKEKKKKKREEGEERGLRNGMG